MRKPPTHRDISANHFSTLTEEKKEKLIIDIQDQLNVEFGKFEKNKDKREVMINFAKQDIIEILGRSDNQVNKLKDWIKKFAHERKQKYINAANKVLEIAPVISTIVEEEEIIVPEVIIEDLAPKIDEEIIPAVVEVITPTIEKEITPVKVRKKRTTKKGINEAQLQLPLD